jgi:hypothetical protein
MVFPLTQRRGLKDRRVAQKIARNTLFALSAEVREIGTGEKLLIRKTEMAEPAVLCQ